MAARGGRPTIPDALQLDPLVPSRALPVPKPGTVVGYAVVTYGPSLDRPGGVVAQTRSPGFDTHDEAKAWRRSDGTQHIVKLVAT